jgi:hypothetical protein
MLDQARKQRLIRQLAVKRAHIVGDVIRHAGGGNDVGDRRMCNHEFQEELCPALGPELLGKIRHRLLVNQRE